MKLRQHSTQCTLCSAVKERGTNLEQIFLFYKSVARIFLAASLPTPRRSASVVMVICMSCITLGEFSPHIHWTERKLAGLDEDHPPVIRCLLQTTRNTGRLVHDSDIIVELVRNLVAHGDARKGK